MTLAHIAGVPVEETLQPLIIAVMLSGAWFGTRLRRPTDSMRKGRTLTPELDCIEVRRRGCDHFIPSLRDHVERGEGSPNGSLKDQARRAAAAAK